MIDALLECNFLTQTNEKNASKYLFFVLFAKTPRQPSPNKTKTSQKMIHSLSGLKNLVETKHEKIEISFMLIPLIAVYKFLTF